MSKCINVDELQEWVENWFYKNRCYHPYAKSNTIPINELYDILENMPAADVAEVVRCKDCKHYQFADNRAFGMPVKMCEWFGFEDVDDDDFCSRAERITE